MPKVKVLADCKGLNGDNLKAGQILDLDYSVNDQGEPVGKDCNLAALLNHGGRIVELDNPKLTKAEAKAEAKEAAKSK